MSQKKTPLLLQLRNASGTVYVFPSASEDVGLNLTNDVTSVALTHYALLNIPAIPLKNLCFGHDQELYLEDKDIKDINPNLILAMSLQNYVMNFETVLLNLENYNYLNLKTVSEKVFWHWLNAVGALKTGYTYTGDDENKKVNYLESEIIPVEYDNKKYWYYYKPENRIVKCFGSIDSGNKVHSEFGMFNETYINVPSSYGSGLVFFTSEFDENYVSGSVYQVDSNLYLEGRKDDNHISYLNNCDKPYFDSYLQQNEKDVYSYNVVAPDVDNPSTEIEGIEIVKDLDVLSKLTGKIIEDNTYRVLSYDELNVDALNRLKLITDENDKTNIDLVKSEFDFNAILLYYSVYDLTDKVSRTHATNLFGIIFLDGASIKAPDNVEEGRLLYIPTMHKRKSTAESFGTGYSFRVNTKTLSIYDNTQGVILDNTTIAGATSENLNGAIQQLNRAINVMNTNVMTTMLILNQYASIIKIYDEQQLDIGDISTLLHDYVEGRTNPLIHVNKLYTDEIYPNNFVTIDPSINFYIPLVGTEGYDKDNPQLSNSILCIKNDGIIANTIHNKVLYSSNYFYLKNYHSGDYNITANNLDLTQGDTVILKKLPEARDLINSIFCNNGIDIKLRTENLTILDLAIESTYDNSYNEYEYDLYINPDSSVFTNVNGIGQFVTTLDSNIRTVDYTGLIPYIIGYLQLLNNFEYIPNNDTTLDTSLPGNATLNQVLTYLIDKQRIFLDELSSGKLSLMLSEIQEVLKDANNISNMANDIKALLDANDTLTNDIETINNEKIVLNQTISTLQNTINDQSKLIKDLQNEIKDIKDAIQFKDK